jgi:endonuclease/exonuclease/phosphatase family metal-dependent hydrolase
VRLLDFYHWNKDKDSREKIIRFFKEKNPDILCLQEFYSKNDINGVNNLEDIKNACGYDYVAECNMQVTKRGKWGSVIFSHLPIVFADNYDIDLQGANLLQHVKIKHQSDTINIFNLHLKSNKLSKPEAGLVGKKELPEWTDTLIEQSKSIFDKLQRSSINRGLEADIIAGIIDQHQHPSIVCGDFNDIPSSYVYFKLRADRKDAFLERGAGLGATYRDAVPLLRIDYMLYDEQLNLHGFKTLDLPYSDHNPLIGQFSLDLE